MAFLTVDEAVKKFREGRMLIIVDDGNEENEGNLCIAAEHISPETLNFMSKNGRGLISVAMTPERLDELEIPLMVNGSDGKRGSAFCVSVEASRESTSGMSAFD
ncbi:MAG TPA: 3,4-dihydroxy-2-butanone-4-phosphate synthase, partial [Armatimonadota bacterium]|nr:3,4-dihydroxy-2-butanone-4-phosphate synthase [Armatimonadota bacterium]